MFTISFAGLTHFSFEGSDFFQSDTPYSADNTKPCKPGDSMKDFPPQSHTPRLWHDIFDTAGDPDQLQGAILKLIKDFYADALGGH